MRRITHIAIAVSITAGLIGSAHSQDVPLASRLSVEGHTNGRVTIDLIDADVRDVLVWLADRAGMNLVFDENVHGSVSVTVSNVPVNDAMRAILQAARLVAVPTASGTSVCVGMTESDCMP